MGLASIAFEKCSQHSLLPFFLHILELLKEKSVYHLNNLVIHFFETFVAWVEFFIMLIEAFSGLFSLEKPSNSSVTLPRFIFQPWKWFVSTSPIHVYQTAEDMNIATPRAKNGLDFEHISVIHMLSDVWPSILYQNEWNYSRG